VSWILTYSGKKFFPLEPVFEDIDVVDIAHSLAQQCRFNGHCRPFYSVAEHSVRVSRIVPASDALWGLLHDASEAYVSDLPRPLKGLVPEFSAAEERLQQLIARRFDLPWPIPDCVHEADNILLRTELRDVMPPLLEAWQMRVDPLTEGIVPVDSATAERMFLNRYCELKRA